MIILYILLVPFAIVCVGSIITEIVDYFKQKKYNSKEELIEEIQKRVEPFVKYEISSQLAADPKALKKSFDYRKRFNSGRLCV